MRAGESEKTKIGVNPLVIIARGKQKRVGDSRKRMKNRNEKNGNRKTRGFPLV